MVKWTNLLFGQRRRNYERLLEAVPEIAEYTQRAAFYTLVRYGIRVLMSPFILLGACVHIIQAILEGIARGFGQINEAVMAGLRYFWHAEFLPDPVAEAEKIVPEKEIYERFHGVKLQGKKQEVSK